MGAAPNSATGTWKPGRDHPSETLSKSALLRPLRSHVTCKNGDSSGFCGQAGELNERRWLER